MKQRFRCLLLGLLLALSLLGNATATQKSNLLQNGDFEVMDAAGNPVDWYSKAYRSQEGHSRLVITDEKAYSGIYSAMVENANTNDARFVCSIPVEPESMYRFSGYILVDQMEDMGNGANLSIEDTFSHSDTLFDTDGEWKYVEWYGETGTNQHRVEISVRVGGYSAESVGKAFFDDLCVEKVDELPRDEVASLWFTAPPDTRQESQTNAVAGGERSTVLFVLCAMTFALLAYLCVPMLKGSASEKLKREENGMGKPALLAFCGLLLVSVVLRCVLGANVEGYQVDINCFTSWALRMVDHGPAGFYEEGYFCDYPPGYMLLLWPVGYLLRAVGLANRPMALLVVKLIPIICDMVIALLLFGFGKRRVFTKTAVCVAMLYAFNPASLVNGAAWGQVDALLALFMLLAAIFAMDRNWRIAIPLFFVGVLVKPQALLLAPVGGLWMLVCLAKEKQERKDQLRQVLWGVLIALGCILVIVTPFAVRKPNPLQWFASVYVEALSSYGYATLNTANLFYLLGANWRPLEEAVGMLLPLITGLLQIGFGASQCYFMYKKKCAFQKAIKSKEVLPASSPECYKKLALATLCVLTGLVLFTWSLVTTMNYTAYGTIMMVFTFCWSLISMVVDNEAKHLPFYMALALIGVYVLGIKIHERYLFAALPLLLLAYCTTRDKRLLLLCVGLSATTFVNTAIILDNSILFGSAKGHLTSDTQGVNICLCIFNLLLCGYGGYLSFSGLRESTAIVSLSRAEGQQKISDSYVRGLLSPPDARLNLSARDWIIMGMVTVLYACVAFIGLGSTVAPQNGWTSTSAQEQIVFEVGGNQPFSLVYYAGVSYDPFSVSVSNDGEAWSEEFSCPMRQGLCYRWQYALVQRENGDFSDNGPEGVLWLTGKYLRLTAGSPGLNLMELVARNPQGETLPLSIVSHTGAQANVLEVPKSAENLLDEQASLQGEPGWYNGTYFDEIYHARTAYEHLHGQPPYETTHPPLGKLMMAVGISLFGMTPFGWRFAGALIGVLMLPALYLLAKQITKRRDLAAFAMLLLTFDLMHFTQTRIATIDSFPVFFIILSYLFMARYMMHDVFAIKKGERMRLMSTAFIRSLVPLALCGSMMGLSIASKWIGMYSAVGLAVLFFTTIFRHFRMSTLAFDLGGENANLTSEQEERLISAREYTPKRVAITCGCCLVFFLLIPALIYYVSYVPYLSPTGPVTLERVWDAQKSMLSYHSQPGLGMDHPYQSPWWEWPLIMKPMWFAQDRFEPAGYASTIFCMGNPLVFYVGLVAMVAALIAFVRKYFVFGARLSLRSGDGDMTLPIIVVGFLAQYLPWVLVPRSTYIYHYFASVPFIILATVWLFSLLPGARPRLRYGLMWGTVAVAAALFVMFYPYASGMLTSTSWLTIMKWFPRIYF